MGQRLMLHRPYLVTRGRTMGEMTCLTIHHLEITGENWEIIYTTMGGHL